MKNKIKQIEDLRIWQEGHSLVLEIYELKKKFPKEEVHVLVPQIIRAAISVPANITEGFNRNTTKEFTQFLYIARGSIGEVIYYLFLAKDLKYIDVQTYHSLRGRYNELGKSINALIKSLKKKI